MDLQQQTPLVVVIAGPTASGKTALSMDLARLLDTSIISADARQCYRGMAIGSAQPSLAEQQERKHYFVNEFSVSDLQSAATFERYALAALNEIFTKNNCAIVCGGSGLYLRALCQGLDEMPAVDAAIAQEVNEGYRLYGLAWLQEHIRCEDPQFRDAEVLKNPARVLRALSFVRSTGKSIIQFQSGQKKQRPFRIVSFAIELPREELYRRINSRTTQMMEAGLLEEAEQMLPYRHLPPLQTVGYAELFEYFDGLCSLDEAIEKIAQHTRNYAKRQLTWFRREEGITWLAPGTLPNAEQLGL